jgi:hypothetical protein
MYTTEQAHAAFEYFENRVQSDIHKRIINQGFYTQADGVPRAPWLDENGREFSYAVRQRAGLHTDFLPFAPQASYPASTCDIPTVTVTTHAAEIEKVTLWEAATNTPTFCLRDFDSIQQITAQLQATRDNMADATIFNWEQELQLRTVALSGNKMIANADIPTGATWSTQDPTMQLNWELLNWARTKLDNRVTEQDGYGKDEEGNFCYWVVAHRDDIDNLKMLDTNTRNDLRARNADNSGPNELLGSPGIPQGRVYRGFKFKAVAFPPRYNKVDGEYVQIFPYEHEEKTHGFGLEVSDAYERAPYTDVVVFAPRLFTHLVPKGPKTRNGYELDTSVTWNGVHRWNRLPNHPETNPDNNKGYWRSTYVYGPQVWRRELGWVIRVKRCFPVFTTFNCGTFPASQ